MAERLKQAHERTLFHLVPLNDKARAVLGQRNNGRFVSNYGTELQPIPGLEVGYHVSKKRSADTIAIVGRQGDLTIDDDQVSRTHFDFRVMPDTFCLQLGKRRAGPSGIYIIAPRLVDDVEQMQRHLLGESFLLAYPTEYHIEIYGHLFQIGWCEASVDSMKVKLYREYEQVKQDALNPNVPVQDKDTVFAQSEWASYHHTRWKKTCHIGSKLGAAHLARFINP